MLNELKNTLQLLDRFIGHYPVYIYLTDADNTVLWVNRFMSKNLPNIAVGDQLRCQNVLHPCVEICEGCSGEELKAANTNFHKAAYRSVADVLQASTYLEFFSFPVITRDKTEKGSLRIGIDVTKNEQLHERLREKEKLFKTIIDTSTDAIIFYDQENLIQSWNKGAEEIFGFSEEEVLGKTAEILMPNELVEIGELSYLQTDVMQKGYLKKYETQRLCKNGQMIYVDISRALVRNEDDEVIGVSEIIKDITSRKDLEFELLRTILELSKLNELNEILHETIDEQEILRIILIAITAGEGLRFNRAFIMLSDQNDGMLKGRLAVGPSDEQEANRIWSELNQDYHYLKDIVQIYNIDLEGTDKKVNEIVGKIAVPIENKNNILIESLLKRRVFEIKDGQLVGCAESLNFDVGDSDLFELLKNDTFIISPVYSKKEPLGVIIADNCINKREITNEDIEGLKLFAYQAGSAIENARLYHTLEERIDDVQNAYQRLEENQEQLVKAERLATIGEMSAKVAHEIRNPLVSIGGFARLIEKRIKADSDIKKYAGIIRDQVDQLEYILNNLLATAKPRAPEKKTVDLENITRQVLQVLENALEQRNVRVTLDFPESPPVINGDPKMLYQAFLNLLKNAMEAVEERANGEIHVAAEPDGDEILLRISDNGPGIETAVVPKIFQTFFTTKSSGTGLGLSIVRQIVESHNGEINVESREGGGTTFVMRFPVAKASIKENELVAGRVN